jgi:methionyl-tRNA formyltransferase
MRLAFLGTPDFAVASLNALLQAGHEVVCVYSREPKPRGRGQTLQPSPVHAFAERHGLMVRTPKSLKTAEEIGAFKALDLDAAVVVAFGQILVAEVLEAPRLGCFNLHASLLPRWRGAAPIQRAIMAGDKITGVQVMQMSVGLDEGDILAGASLRIDALETAGTLHDRLMLAGASLLPPTLAAIISGNATPTPQAAEGVTYARKISAAEARIDWTRPAVEVDRHIRGLAPFPGAWFEHPTAGRIKALLSRAEEGQGEPGSALDDGLLIACGDGAVRLLAAQREGRSGQDAETFLRGFPVPAGTRLS